MTYIEYLIDTYDISDIYNKKYSDFISLPQWCLDLLCEDLVVDKLSLSMYGISITLENLSDKSLSQVNKANNLKQRELRHSLKKEYERFLKINSVIYDI